MKVYLIGDDLGHFKIGVSNSPAKRLLALNTPQPLRLLCEVNLQARELALKVEAKLHQFYERRHVRGEWFRNIDVEDFKRRVAEFEANPTPFIRIEVPSWRKVFWRNLLLAKDGPTKDSVWAIEHAKDQEEIDRCYALREQGIEDYPYSYLSQRRPSE